MTTTRTDWPKILGDIAYMLGEPLPGSPVRMPLSQQQLADALQYPRGTLRNWLEGSEPKHTDGERLIERWCALTGKARTFVPREVVHTSSAAKAGQVRKAGEHGAACLKVA